MWHPRPRTPLLTLCLSVALLQAQDPKPEPTAPQAAPAAAAKAPAKSPVKGKAKAKRPKPAATDARVKPEVALKSKVRSEELKAAKAKTKPIPPSQLVDLNRASREELLKLPGMTEAYADKLIAGRPYKTKIHLVTKGILPYAVYTSLKARVIARQ